MRHLSNYILGKGESNITLACYRSKAETYAAFEGNKNNAFVGMAAGPFDNYDLNINKLVYCTIAKCRNILLSMDEATRVKVSWLLVDDWDQYDANAYALYGLWQHYNMKDTCRMVFVSISPWVYLPVIKTESIAFDFSNIKVEYTTARPLDLARKAKALTLYYGPALEVGNRHVKHLLHLEHDADASAVIDSLTDARGQNISKHIAVLRANSINTGIIYRCKSERDFNALANNYKRHVLPNLEKVIFHLLSEGIDPIKLFPADHQKVINTIKQIVKVKQLDTIHLKFVAHSGLDYMPSIFLHDWISLAQRNRRLIYIGCLTACLINHAPSLYGPLGKYQPFIGRNDIETLHNMWGDLITSSNQVVFELTANNKRALSNWCRDNGFHYEGMLTLCALVNRTYDRHIRDVEKMRTISKGVTTRQLNALVKLLCDTYPERDNTFILTDVLPHREWAAPAQKLVPIRTMGKHLLIYVNNDNELVDIQRTLDDVSDF